MQAVDETRVDYLEDHAHELLDYGQVLQEVLAAVRRVLLRRVGAARFGVQRDDYLGSLLGQQIKQAVYSLTHIRMQVVEFGGHVGQSGQTIRVQVLVSHACHVELYGPDDN